MDHFYNPFSFFTQFEDCNHPSCCTSTGPVGKKPLRVTDRTQPIHLNPFGLHAGIYELIQVALPEIESSFGDVFFRKLADNFPTHLITARTDGRTKECPKVTGLRLKKKDHLLDSFRGNFKSRPLPSCMQ